MVEDTIGRQAAINHLKERLIETALNNVGIMASADDVYREMAENRIDVWIDEMPTAQPERLTNDDFETIRIHLSAYKEKLCNQNRWKEAEEYQRIIDRFMAFASAQPEREKGEWIYGEDEYGIDGYRCDECGFFVPWDYVHTFINYIEDYNFCPNCGAEMRGDANG